jgi:hypothetical protein
MNISPYFSTQLRKRFNEDMIMSKLATKTQIAHIRSVNKLCDYLQRSAKTTTQEELREFQLFMVNHGVSGLTVNASPNTGSGRCISSAPSTWHKSHAGHVSLEQLKVMSGIEHCLREVICGLALPCLLAYSNCL